MNATRILDSEQLPLGWVCRSCTTLWTDEAEAGLCCLAHPCTECRRPVVSGRALCVECTSGDRFTLDKSLFSKATKVYYHDYEGAMIYWNPPGESGRFFCTRTAVDKYCLDKSIPTPRWVWGTNPFCIELSADKILEHTYPGLDQLVEEESVTDLQQKLDDWTASLRVQESKVNYSVAVVLDRDLLEELRQISNL